MTQQECASIVLIMIQIFGSQVCFVGEDTPHHVANNDVREIQIIKGISKNNKFYDTEGNEWGTVVPIDQYGNVIRGVKNA